jgi:hypothetical protein
MRRKKRNEEEERRRCANRYIEKGGNLDGALLCYKGAIDIDALLFMWHA